MTEGHIAIAPSRKTLLAIIGGGTIVAAAILVGAVLPAEYRLDPLGIGAATGLLEMSGPKEVEVALPASEGANAVARVHDAALRTDTVEIKLAPAGDPDQRSDLEWKVRMKEGATLVYSWTADAPAEEFYSDLHGETPPAPEVKVATYKKGVGTGFHGSVVAPFDGIHGWYLQNQSEHPVTVHLTLSGFYEMPPDPYAAQLATN
jgi:hypothetical protein